MASSSLSKSQFCHNPYCEKKYTKYASERAYSMHLKWSETCRQFLMNNSVLNPSTGERLPILLSSCEDDIVYQSNKASTFLQRDFTNHTSTNVLFSHTFLESSSKCLSSNDKDSEMKFEFLDDDAQSLDSEFIPIILPPAAIHNHHPSQFLYTTDQKWTVALLKLLDSFSAPDYAFGLILK